jgi:hypothetical protein
MDEKNDMILRNIAAITVLVIEMGLLI